MPSLVAIGPQIKEKQRPPSLYGFSLNRVKDDRAFSLLNQGVPQILVLCFLSVPAVKILKKIGVTGKIWKKARVKLLRDLTEKSVNFSTSVTSNIRLLLVFGEEDQ